MRNRYYVCVFYKRWRFCPQWVPLSVSHSHFGPEGELTTWEDAHGIWTDLIAEPSLLQAVLFRDDEPVRVFHHKGGEGRPKRVAEDPEAGA